MEWATMCKWVIRVGFAEKETFKHPEGSKEVSHVDIWGRAFQAEGTTLQRSLRHEVPAKIRKEPGGQCGWHRGSRQGRESVRGEQGHIPHSLLSPHPTPVPVA